MAKLGGFVIAFRRPHVLRQTLQQILQQSRSPEFLIVVDNGNTDETRHMVRELGKDNVVYHTMGENVGPAGAAAYALQRLATDGFDWIYWGDEDDPPQFPDTLERVMSLAETCDPDVVGIGAVGSLFDWEKGETVRLPDHALKGTLNVDSIGGNSQFVLRKEAVFQVGVPDQRLFFGFYEPEYCLRLRKAGYRLQVDGDLMRRHREKAGRLNLNLRRNLISQYPYELIWRRYYRTRNYIFMMRNTFGRPDLARRETWKALGRTLFAWSRGWKYGRTFFSLQVLGILHGYRGQMGRTVLPQPKLCE